MEDNNKMGLKVVGLESVNCTELAQDRDKWMAIVNTITSVGRLQPPRIT
jgi:hypothetical protein